MTNMTSQSHKSGFKYIYKKKTARLESRKKFPFASFHKCVIGLWCLTPRRQVFVFPFLKPKVGLFRLSQTDYSRDLAPEEEKLLISARAASHRSGRAPSTRPASPTRAVKPTLA